MNNSNAPTDGGTSGGRCTIRVKGHLDPRWSTWFDGFAVTTETGGTTVIEGAVADQAALFGLLQRLRDVGVSLVSVDHVD